MAGLLASTVCGQNPDLVAAREIAGCDRDFSARSQAEGMPAACLHYFADDGIALTPEAINGKKYWSSHRTFDGELIWQPIFAAAASAGDLGYTTGPWELKKNGSSAGFGNYVTVWRRQPKGDWKIALDVGIENPQPSEPPSQLQLLPADAPSASQVDARKAFEDTFRGFLTACGRDIGKAILTSAADSIRVYRDKSAPAVGINAARILLESAQGKEIRQAGRSFLSKSADLAYCYGNYASKRGNVTDRGVFLTISRRNLNQDWQLVLDLKKKLPAGNT